MHVHLVLLTWLVGVAHSAREEDLVEYLPGLDPQPDFNHYAGYLNVDDNKKFFYWFVESESPTAADDPVVLWLNGGPGCSSLTGFLVELGPWRVDPSGEFLHWFEHRWNKIANIIFMESPQCVGYSYAEDGDCSSGDDQTAHDNHRALQDFFAGFPEYRANEFYVTGESYAGIYVPTLSRLLMDDPDFNFQGFAVGNGVTDYDMMDNALVPFLWARGLFGTDLYNDLLEHCCDWNATYCDYRGDNGPECSALMIEVNYVAWASGLNPYNAYDECYGGAPTPDGIFEETDTMVRMVHPGTVPMVTKEAREAYREFFRQKGREKPELYSSIPCTDTSDRETYLNKPEVREALHVPDTVQVWEACSTNVSMNWQYDYDDMRQQYLELNAAGHRGLVFNGDLDIACNHLGDMWFVESLGLPQDPDGHYKEWFYDDEVGTWQIAGYVLQDENLKFLTVKGAGHFVPTDKPWPAYIMWEKFINDEPY